MPAVDFFLTEGVYNILRKGLFIHALLLSCLIIIKNTHKGNIDKQWRHDDNAKKVFVYKLFCQLRKIFYQKKDNDGNRKIAPWRIVPQKIAPDPKPKAPSNPNPEGIFWGQSSGGATFPVTDNNMLLLRMLVKEKAKENFASIETVQ